MQKRRIIAIATVVILLTSLVSPTTFARDDSATPTGDTGIYADANIGGEAYGDFTASRVDDDIAVPAGYFEAAYRNNSSVTAKGTIILAIYGKSGKLVKHEYKTIEAAAYETVEFTFDTAAGDYLSPEYTYDIFCWDENFVPTPTRANIAERKAAYQSGAIDEYNTATLVSDGVISRPEARSFALAPWESISRYYREWIYVDLGAPTAVTNVTTTWGSSYATRYHIQTSDDGVNWTNRVDVGSNTVSNGNYTSAWANAAKSDNVTGNVTARFVRILCDSASGGRSGQGNYIIKGVSVNGNVIDKYYASNGFDSYWISKGKDQQWVYVDLGVKADISGARVTWGGNYATDYDIQVSDDASSWTTVATAAGKAKKAVTSNFTANARYARVLCKTSSGTNYMIKEFEVLANNPLPKYDIGPLPAPEADGTQYLRGGNWKLERASEVKADGVTLSKAGYNDFTWMPATVPGTTLASYLKAGAVGDPYYDNYNLDISDTYFTTDFWYRNSFVVPASQTGRDVWLNFDEINYRADIYFNGHKLSNNTNPDRGRSIEGGFIRGKFDVTPYVNYGAENYLAVFIQMNDSPWGYSNASVGATGSSASNANFITKYVTNQWLNAGPWPNGGNLGIDNPTFHAAIGWDWMPSIRGRDCGINEDVFITYTDGVEMLDPWMVTDLDITPVQTGEPIVTPMVINSAATVTQPAGQNGVGLANLFDGSLNNQWLGDTGSANPSFTLSLPAAITVNTIVINWGEVLPAAATEYQNAKSFKLEVSDDGVTWRNYDAYPAGGTGANAYPASAGTASYEGGIGSNTIKGPTNPISNAVIARSFRYFRFTTLEKMTSVQSAQGVLPPKVTEVQFFSQSRAEVVYQKYNLDASKADLTYKTEVKNNKNTDVTAVIDGVINPGGLTFTKTVSVPAGSTTAVDIPFVMNNPDLWWPNTYGDQPLYTVTAKLTTDGKLSDTKSFKFGVREFTYPVDSGAVNRLGIYCNGTFIIAKGGNWGMDDAMQMDTPERYDDKVRLHAEENMTMIRNWVGQTHHKGFYDACDKYGIMIWDDFWLANPVDGPNPKDTDMFNENAIDKVKTVRTHAAMTVYVGRNESNPAAPLLTTLPQIVSQYDGTRFYFPNSSAAPVGSGGGYSLADYRATGNTQGMKNYFNNVSSNVLRSERGIPNVPTIQSIKRFVAPENQWPISETWAHHDWTYMMNGPANTYMNALKSYMPEITWTFPNSPGGSQNQDPEGATMVNYRNTYTPMLKELADKYTLEDFSTVAQMINYENHKALFQALTVTRANGLLMWMSQSSWPSFMWQTYDYYLDTNGGYFGTKAGNQPTQPVWDPRNNNVYLSNYTPKDYENVKTEITVYNLNGRVVSSSAISTAKLDSVAYGVLISNLNDKFALSDTDMVFIKLVLKDKAGKVLGENIYWHNKVTYLANQALTTLPKVNLTTQVSEPVQLAGGNVEYTITLKNNSKVPAVQTRIRNVSSVTGDDVLPTFFSDNYFILMPGDSKVVTAEFNPKYLQGGTQEFELSGWNTAGEGGTVSTLKMVTQNATAETKSLFEYLGNQTDKIMFGHQTDETGIANTGSDTVRAVGDRPSVLATTVGAGLASIRDAYARGQVISAEHHVNVAAGFGNSYGNSTTGDMAWGHRVVPGQAYHANLVNYLHNTVAPWARSLTVSATDPTLIPIIYRPWHEHNGDWFWWNTPNTTEGEMAEIFRFTVEYLRDVEGITNFIYAFSPNGHFDNEEEYLYAYPGDEYIDLMGIDIYWDIPESNPDWFDLMIKDCRIAMDYAKRKGKVAALTECGLRWNAKDGFQPLGEYEGNGKAKGEAALQTKKLSEEQRTWYTTMANRILNDDVANGIAYMNVWRQGVDGSNLHFWVPFKDYTAPNNIQPTYDRGYLGDHQALGDFVDYYNKDGVKFLSETSLDPIYTTAASTEGNKPYVNIKAPVKDEILIANPPAPNPAYVVPDRNPRPSNPAQGKYRVLVYPALLPAGETVTSAVVSFAGQTVNAVKGTDLNGDDPSVSGKPAYYYADVDIRPEAVADGRHNVSVTVNTSGGNVLTSVNSVKVKNAAAAAKDPYVIDDFDSYDRTDDNRTDLERVWFRDSGSMVGLRLREAKGYQAEGFGTGNVLRLKYDTCRVAVPHNSSIYYSGFYRTYSPAVNLSEAKKLSMVVQSDGKAHNLAFLVTVTGNRVYQAYASDSDTPYNRSLKTPQTLSIDISKFKLMSSSGFGDSLTAADLASVTRFSVRMESEPGVNFGGLNAKEFYLFDDMRWLKDVTVQAN